MEDALNCVTPHCQPPLQKKLPIWGFSWYPPRNEKNYCEIHILFGFLVFLHCLMFVTPVCLYNSKQFEVFSNFLIFLIDFEWFSVF